MPVRRSPDRPPAPQLVPPDSQIPRPKRTPGRGRWTYAFRPRLPPTALRRSRGVDPAFRLRWPFRRAPFSGEAETPTETCVAPPSAAQQHAARRQMGRGTEDGERRETRDGPTGEQWGGPFSSADLENGKCDERAASRLTSLLSRRGGSMPYRLSGKMTATSRRIHPGGGEPSAGIPKSPPPPKKADDCKSPHFLTYHRARPPRVPLGVRFGQGQSPQSLKFLLRDLPAQPTPSNPPLRSPDPSSSPSPPDSTSIISRPS